MSKPSVLETLSEGQQSQLLTWLETMSLAEVLQKVNSPPPEGFGARTYMTSLRRFQARHNRAQRAELLTRQPPLAREADHLLRSAQAELLQHALHLATTSHSTSSAISGVAKIIVAQQNHAHRVRELELREQTLKLAKERLELERQTVAAELIIKEARIHHSNATGQIKDAADRILATGSPEPQPSTIGNEDGTEEEDTGLPPSDFLNPRVD